MDRTIRNKRLKSLYQQCIIEMRGHCLEDVIALKEELEEIKELVDSDLKFYEENGVENYKDGEIIKR